VPNVQPEVHQISSEVTGTEPAFGFVSVSSVVDRRPGRKEWFCVRVCNRVTLLKVSTLALNQSKVTSLIGTRPQATIGTQAGARRLLEARRTIL
jgi:hypothetical protein